MTCSAAWAAPLTAAPAAEAPGEHPADSSGQPASSQSASSQPADGERGSGRAGAPGQPASPGDWWHGADRRQRLWPRLTPDGSAAPTPVATRTGRHARR